MNQPYSPHQAEAAAVAEVAKRAHQVELIETASGQLLSIPDAGGKRTVVDVREITNPHLEKPRRAQGTASLLTIDAFVAHTKRFKTEDSIIFADPDPEDPSLLAIYDYHHETNDARYCSHQGRLVLQRSKAWKAWSAAGARPMSVTEFAEFLEERIDDVLDPSGDNAQKTTALAPLFGSFAGPSKLLELKEGLAVRVDQQVTNTQKLSSGEGVFHFSENHKDAGGGPLKIPGAFLIGISVFEGDARYPIVVRLRYTISSGKIHWRILLHNAERAFDDAFALVVESAREKADMPVLIGAPE